VKKFIIGLLCGAVLSMTTVAVATNAIQAVLFPSKVTFYTNNMIKELDGTGDNTILNYNNKAYIPLRSFADAMGAKVTYGAPSTNGGSAKIDVFNVANSTYSIYTFEEGNGMCTPINLSLEPPHEYYDEKTFGELSLGKINLFQFALSNESTNEIVLNPLDDLQFEVYKMNAQNLPVKLVYSYKLPTITGWTAYKSGYLITIPWNQKGSDGYQITAGNYLVKLKKPDSINYTIKGSDEIKSTMAAQGMGCNRNRFGVHFK
jgi:hypothetical protein